MGVQSAVQIVGPPSSLGPQRVIQVMGMLADGPNLSIKIYWEDQ